MFGYTPKPTHQIIPLLILLAAAIIAGSFPSGYTIVFFFIATIASLVTSIWIAVAGVMEKYTEYWTAIGEDIRKLEKANPDIWYALGFSRPPESVTLKANVTGQPGESMDYTLKVTNLPVSPIEMKIIADGILTGSKTFAESDWVNTQIGQTKIREVKRELIRLGLLAPNSMRNSRLGFSPTEAGKQMLYQYASEWVKDLKEISPPSSSVDIPQNVP